MGALGYSRRSFGKAWAAMFLTTVFLTTSWAAAGFSLPLFYIGAYALRAVRLLTGAPVRTKSWFLLNLGFINMMVLHLIFIGAASLAQDLGMAKLLADGSWRVGSMSFVIAVNLVEDLIFLKKKNFLSVLAAEMESAEAPPFMAFLWFCTGYVLADSLLCAVELEPMYPPLFLIGSSAVLMSFLVCFLLHINTIIQSNRLRDEYGRLAAELERKEQRAGALKHLADRDSLTGVFSRRYAMERISDLIGAGEAFTLIFLDLDGLKRINDKEGHDAGDRYLIRFADMLNSKLREGDMLARMGGDEFLVLLRGCGKAAGARRIEEIRREAERKTQEGFPVRFSYGVTEYCAGAVNDAEELLLEADRAMYQDKERRHGERDRP